jgi:hypothetical protein
MYKTMSHSNGLGINKTPSCHSTEFRVLERLYPEMLIPITKFTYHLYPSSISFLPILSPAFTMYSNPRLSPVPDLDNN